MRVLLAASALAAAMTACSSVPVAKPMTAGQPSAAAAISPRALAQLERDVKPFLAQARASYPDAKRRFLAGLPQGDRFYVSVKLSDPAGRVDHSFVFVATYQGTEVLGRIASEVSQIGGYAVGDPYAGPESDILDWVIIHADGSEEGNVVGNFLRQRR